MAKEIIELSAAARSIKAGIYRHFKGDEYQVFGISLSSETFEEFVVYKHLNHGSSGQPYYWVRPLKMFLEVIDKDGYKGPRFTFLREQ